ncbi:uncharacterized protein NPIL_600621 [Nephila pilipes]|uniref:Uncharacterized protein n=1 Tax=Nephila pilipes TaxID=299642 RepID=A0A8X6TFN6_NEPPI|nr:uncharacterized protein NPIL_600621 [Nephila pilipes]
MEKIRVGSFASTLDSETRLSFASSEEVPSPPKFDSSRTLITTKPPCLNCNKAERHKRKQSSQTRKKQIPTTSKDTKRLPPTKNNTVEFPKKKKMKFSRKYDPTGKPEDDGFIPIPGPYGVKTTPRSAQRRARIRSPEELVVKESRQSPNILGNGNFEILKGGIFSDDESNEIGEGRRIGRNYDSFSLRPFQQIPFNVPTFQFPSFYQGQLQVPTHPMFFPRAAY